MTAHTLAYRYSLTAMVAGSVALLVLVNVAAALSH